MQGRTGRESYIVNLFSVVMGRSFACRQKRECFYSAYCLVVIMGLMAFNPIFGQRSWDGGGGDSQWNNPLNWTGDSLPVPGQEVILDNSVVDGSYEVVMPSDSQQVIIARLGIIPQPGDSIKVRIPKESKVSPALILTGSGYSMLIGMNGIFENASGASSGVTIDIGDSIRIENGGHFIHRTARSHAALVSVLSRSEGTEEGIFEFDVPSASTTIALTDRVFGSLVLSSAAAGGFINYTAAGTKKVRVRSDLHIRMGARLNLNFSDSFRVEKNLRLEKGFLNLASNTRSLVMLVGDSLLINDSSSLVRSGSGRARIILSGNQEQGVFCAGTIQKDISVVINNPYGVRLLKEWESPDSLYLERGKIISSDASMLILRDSANLISDSLQMDAYVEGPLRLSTGYSRNHLLVPLGAEGSLRWLAIKNMSGDLTFTYIRNNPLELYTTLNGLDHISRVEYWSVRNNSAVAVEGQVELSFVDASSGGVTEMSSLSVAGSWDGAWINRGGASWTGSAGSRGSVTSNVFTLLPGEQYVTLAGTQPAQNPLPLVIPDFKYFRKGDLIVFSWLVSEGADFREFHVQSRKPGHTFSTDTSMIPVPGIVHYELRLPLKEEGEYRIMGITHNDLKIYSRSVYIIPQREVYEHTRIVGITEQGNNIMVHVESVREEMIEIVMYSNAGELVYRKKEFLHQGMNKLICERPGRRDSIYHIFGVLSKRRTNTVSMVF